MRSLASEVAPTGIEEFCRSGFNRDWMVGAVRFIATEVAPTGNDELVGAVLTSKGRWLL